MYTVLVLLTPNRSSKSLNGPTDLQTATVDSAFMFRKALIAPASSVCAQRRALRNPRHNPFHIHRVVPQPRDTIPVLVIAVPAVLGPVAVVNLSNSSVLAQKRVKNA